MTASPTGPGTCRSGNIRRKGARHARQQDVLIAGALAFAFALALPATAAETPEDAAQKAAVSWLKVVDAGDYAASWDQAAAFFKGAVTREQWTQAAAGVRGPLGKLVSRKMKSRELKTSLPGAPDGKYVVVQFDTRFANKAAAVETVTPMLDPDGKWRVSGYFIR